jgi:putative heme iron utilization protein
MSLNRAGGASRRRRRRRPLDLFFFYLFPLSSFSPSFDKHLRAGTYASYVLDPRGQPLLRLRADAVHTANLVAQPRCSLFVQPPDRPGRLLARATLIGVASPLSGEESREAAERHAALHGEGSRGVDAPRGDDLYYRLGVETCFYVAGLGGASDAAVISSEEYAAARPDELRRAAPALAAEFNADRAAEVARIAAAAAGVSFDDLSSAELLWVDEAGCYVWASFLGGDHSPRSPAVVSPSPSSSHSLESVDGACLRVPFPRKALDERDARSALTMLSQLAWEAERQYVPPLPAAVASAEGVA